MPVGSESGAVGYIQLIKRNTMMQSTIAMLIL